MGPYSNMEQILSRHCASLKGLSRTTSSLFPSCLGSGTSTSMLHTLQPISCLQLVHIMLVVVCFSISCCYKKIGICPNYIYLSNSITMSAWISQGRKQKWKANSHQYSWLECLWSGWRNLQEFAFVLWQLLLNQFSPRVALPCQPVPLSSPSLGTTLSL